MTCLFGVKFCPDTVTEVTPAMMTAGETVNIAADEEVGQGFGGVGVGDGGGGLGAWVGVGLG